jgi:hypothetical protein
MEIKINKGQIITSVCLAVAGWFAMETYSQAQRISALEEDKSIHQRQDKELQEIRKSIQDMTILFFQEREELVVPSYDNANPNHGFSAAQTDLRNLREGK